MSNRAELEDSFKTRVLLVDDNEAFRRVAAEFLERQHGDLEVDLIPPGVGPSGDAQRLPDQLRRGAVVQFGLLRKAPRSSLVA